MSPKVKTVLDPAALAARLRDYFAGRPDVVAAYRFGSPARGPARAESDLDTAVLPSEADGRVRFDRRLRLIVEVSDVCGREADVIGPRRILHGNPGRFDAHAATVVDYLTREGEEPGPLPSPRGAGSTNAAGGDERH